MFGGMVIVAGREIHLLGACQFIAVCIRRMFAFFFSFVAILCARYFYYALVSLAYSAATHCTFREPVR